eukprot:5735774-Alexandrium_andersonii.AAC.1
MRESDDYRHLLVRRGAVNLSIAEVPQPGQPPLHTHFRAFRGRLPSGAVLFAKAFQQGDLECRV